MLSELQTSSWLALSCSPKHVSDCQSSGDQGRSALLVFPHFPFAVHPRQSLSMQHFLLSGVHRRVSSLAIHKTHILPPQEQHQQCYCTAVYCIRKQLQCLTIISFNMSKNISVIKQGIIIYQICFHISVAVNSKHLPMHGKIKQQSNYSCGMSDNYRC